MQKLSRENFAESASVEENSVVYDSSHFHILQSPSKDKVGANGKGSPFSHGLLVSYGEGLPSEQQISLANRFSLNCDERFFAMLDFWINEYRLAKFDLHPDCYDDYKHVSIDNIREYYDLFQMAILKNRIGRGGHNYFLGAFHTGWYGLDAEMILDFRSDSISCVAIHYFSGLDQGSWEESWAESPQRLRERFGGVPWKEEEEEKAVYRQRQNTDQSDK